MGVNAVICERCNSLDATVHVTKVIDGTKKEIHMCENCAKKQETIDFETPFTTNNFLANLIDSVQSSPLKVNYIKTTTCSKCGMNYGKFKQTGRLGCDECYQTFEEKLIPLIKRVHGYENHTGKIPKRASVAIRMKREIMDLQKELDRVVSKQAFEKAVEIRDRIHYLEEELKQSGEHND